MRFHARTECGYTELCSINTLHPTAPHFHSQQHSCQTARNEEKNWRPFIFYFTALVTNLLSHKCIVYARLAAILLPLPSSPSPSPFHFSLVFRWLAIMSSSFHRFWPLWFLIVIDGILNIGLRDSLHWFRVIDFSFADIFRGFLVIRSSFVLPTHFRKRIQYTHNLIHFKCFGRSTQITSVINIWEYTLSLCIGIWHSIQNTQYTLHTHITEYTQLIVYYSYFVSPVAIRVQGEREKYFVGAFAIVVKVSATV